MKRTNKVKWSKRLTPIMDADAGSLEDEFENLKLDIAISLEREIERQSISYTELAERISTSPAYITKVLRGDSNLTLHSLLKFARALHADLNISLDSKIEPVEIFSCGAFPRNAANREPMPAPNVQQDVYLEKVTGSLWWDAKADADAIAA
ncbi:helix-turn-helix transcriptional regulator [Methyloversatilis discipulorum]|uniref:helix-turn-helix domain-containing protein n=1 Tax=Methyloversatilis discipulorum TaxID=1119528 RepID=UPI0031377059